MTYRLIAPSTLHGQIHLPASKSLSNRALILNALSQGKGKLSNLSDCDDTSVMIEALRSGQYDLNIGAAGTAMRFLTAYLCLQPGRWTLTGTERMKNRPIAVLVEALRKLGATVEYGEKPGYPPLTITGGPVQGGCIEIEGGISSQYLSALMMAGPCMDKGLTLNIKGDLISQPYARMTLQMMAAFGVMADWQEKGINIPKASYQAIDYTVESDWSAASYWYELLSLAPSGELFLKGLEANSLQGDAAIADFFQSLGVKTTWEEGGVRLTKTSVETTRFEADLTDQPDLAQTLAVTCAALERPFCLTGLASLKIKETDRIAALQTEAAKLGFVFEEFPANGLSWTGKRCVPTENPVISTYEDHRMALSFAPFAFRQKGLQIEHPEVVSKSYPTFWNALAAVGFSVEHL
ncbi:MAG: 3-phosphoshikimate 1-carboxyvinyltransferase [Bacteroidales bacterium]|nr:3-phosphoshikimate 1-carboxyvinyltransferase [Bacteroidales bacterium]